MPDVKQQTTKTTKTTKQGVERRRFLRDLRGVRRSARREAALLRELRRAPARQGRAGRSVLRERRQARPPWRHANRRAVRGPSGCRALLRRAADRRRDRGPGRQWQRLEQRPAARRRHQEPPGGRTAARRSPRPPLRRRSPATGRWSKGYTVELKTLPTDGTDQAAVDSAKQDATSQGATDVGIINTSEFTVTPAPPGGAYVLYSGQFKSKAEATKALGKLKAKFKDAQVVSVKKNSERGGAAGQQDRLRRRPQGRGLHAERPEGGVGHGAGQPAVAEDRQELRRLAEETCPT